MARIVARLDLNQDTEEQIIPELMNQTYDSQMHDHNAMGKALVIVAGTEGGRPLTPLKSATDENGNNTCRICEKNFASIKALYGHMRVHQNRGWKGIVPPDQLSTGDKPVRESINKDDGETSNRKRKTIMRPNFLCNESDVDDHDHNPRKKISVAKNGYMCSTCNRSFPNHQALGGHMSAGHGNHDRNQGDDDQHGDLLPLLERIDDARVLVELTHRCKLCDRAFSTGQALGGHQRLHWRPCPVDDDTRSSMTSVHDVITRSNITSVEEVTCTTSTTTAWRRPFDFDLNEPPTILSI